MTREEIFEHFPDEDFLFLEPAEYYDPCIIGVADTPTKSRVIAYDAEAIIETLMREDGMDETDAVEYFYFNTVGAYMGEKTPVYVFTNRRYFDEPSKNIH